MAAKALDLFQAYAQEKLPQEGGYIVSSFFDASSTYSRYEVVAFSSVKSIYLAGDGLTFQTDGNKLYVLVEPPNYSKKHIEPVNRDSSDQVPHRFSELEIYVSKNQTKVMVSKDPIIAYSAFTVLRPTGINFALLFYNVDDVHETLAYFFEQTLHKETGIAAPDAKKAARLVKASVEKFNIW